MYDTTQKTAIWIKDATTNPFKAVLFDCSDFSDCYTNDETIDPIVALKKDVLVNPELHFYDPEDRKIYKTLISAKKIIDDISLYLSVKNKYKSLIDPETGEPYKMPEIKTGDLILVNDIDVKKSVLNLENPEISIIKDVEIHKNIKDEEEAKKFVEALYVNMLGKIVQSGDLLIRVPLDKSTIRLNLCNYVNLEDKILYNRALKEPHEGLVLVWKNDDNDLSGAVVAHKGSYFYTETTYVGQDIDDLSLDIPDEAGLFLYGNGKVWSDEESWGLSGDYTPITLENAAKHFGLTEKEIKDRMKSYYPFTIEAGKDILDVIHHPEGEAPKT